MEKIKTFILQAIEDFLSILINRIRFISKLHSSEHKLNLVDLTPNDNTTENSTYHHAIAEALKNSKINNIALTGPYGSGKSSIIKSFQKSSKGVYKVLNISLASFKDNYKNEPNEESENKKNQLIERSILQQLLYGENSYKLENSRFKKIPILSKRKSLFQALSITMWICIIFTLYIYHPNLINYIITKNEILLASVALITYIISIPTLILYDFLKIKDNFSFKKMSLKNIEIETSEKNENSILNRHLDEIIYFFQVTKYDLVVFEDLDRFGSPEIFVKLREINKLINDNDLTKGNVRFLYAIKDDMFSYKNRAKFFDIIIPVIPVVSSSNSFDKIIKDRLNDSTNTVHIKLKRTKFLREVSYYLNDLRLIHNIFNEFEIYYNELKKNKPDEIKLLALIIYKNSYPKDFELLHLGKGALAELCKHREELINKKRESIRDSIQDIRESIIKSSNESISDISDLISIYLFRISINSGGSYGYYDKNRNLISFNDINDVDKFNLLIERMNTDGSLNVQTSNGTNTLSKSFHALEKLVNPDRTFSQRCWAIRNKNLSLRALLTKQIVNKEREITNLYKLKLAELLKEDVSILDSLSPVIDNDDPSADASLFRYLVVEGHLDESHYLYSSNFYEGRKTINDQKYIMAVRSQNLIEYAQPIDNPSEVCFELRDSDYSSNAILNINLIDYLVCSDLTEQREYAFDFIGEHLTDLEGFFTSYFSTSKDVIKFIQLFSSHYTSYAKDVINYNLNTEHLRLILAHVDHDFIQEEMNEERCITKYLSSYLGTILVGEFADSIDKKIIQNLKIVIDDISMISEFAEWHNFIYKESAYKINEKNIRHLLSRQTDINLIDISNYTSILDSDLSELKQYINDNISEYFEEVFVKIERNTNESLETVISLMNNSKLNGAQKSIIIKSQNFELPKIIDAPIEQWFEIAKNNKMSATWDNIAALEKEEILDNSEFSELLDSSYYAHGLSMHPFPRHIQKEIREQISKRILFLDGISSESYRMLTSKLPYRYTNFPKLESKEKLKILIENNIIEFNENSFDFAITNGVLTEFLIKNIRVYLRNKSNLKNIDNNTIEELILSSISDNEKVNILSDLKHLKFNYPTQLAAEITRLLLENKITINSVDPEVLHWASYSSGNLDTSIKIITKFIPYWSENKVFSAIVNLSTPYNRISQYGRRPKIDNNEVNLKLVSDLEIHGYISSYRVKDNYIEVNTKVKK